MQSKNVQHRREFDASFPPLADWRRGRDNPGAGEQAHLITVQFRATNRYYPLAVSFGVAPADNAAKQFTIERFQFSNQLFRDLMGKPLNAGVGCSRQASVSAFSPALALPSNGVPRCHSVGVVINCGEEGNCSSVLRSRRICFIACVTSSCSWRSFCEASSRFPASRSRTSSGCRRAEPANGSELNRSPSLRSSNRGWRPAERRHPPVAHGSCN